MSCSWPEVDDVFNSGILTHKFGLGRWVTMFEGEFSRRNGSRFCCLYGAGTKGELLKLLAFADSEHKYMKAITGIYEFEEHPAVAVLTDDGSVWLTLKQIGSQGYDFDAEYGFKDFLGVNWRASELSAAVLYHLLVNCRLTVMRAEG